MISWVSAISHREPPAMIISRPANCPADVRLVREMRTACQIVRPPCTAIIPNVKETARYPRAIGIPSAIPCLKLSFFMKDFLRFLLPEFLLLKLVWKRFPAISTPHFAGDITRILRDIFRLFA